MITSAPSDGGRAAADARRQLGLPGGGPKYCVTPLCVMDFAEADKHMRLHALHPGGSRADVQAQTGFDLMAPESAPTTPRPTPEELHVLRTRVDLAGLLRRSTREG